MDEGKQGLHDYLLGKVNAVKLGEHAVLSRELTPTGFQHLILTLLDEEYMDAWKNPVKSKSKGLPKHTGGKKPYLLLMSQEVMKLKEQGITNVEELVGFLICVGSAGSIEWGTGRLVKKRSKRPLKYVDLENMFSGGRTKLNRILGELKEHDLLFYTQEGYFVSTKIIKKGRTK